MLLADLVATSAEVAATRSRRVKVAALAACLQRMLGDEAAIGASYLAGQPRQERLDIGWAGVHALDVLPAAEPTLTLVDTHRGLDRLVGLAGPGSRSARLDAMRELLAAATTPEQRFLRGLVLGELRQGALAGIVVQALAAAHDVDEAQVRRAVMLCGDLGAVAEALAVDGAEALRRFTLEVFRGVHPMLAQTAEDLAAAVEDLGSALVEWKLDGARVQVHRRRDSVRVLTRNLRDVTGRSAEVVAAALALPVESIVLDGEAIALRADGRPRPFQETMSRFGTGRGAPGSAAAPSTGAVAGMSPYFFDVLHVDGEDLLDRPLRERRAVLTRLVPEDQRIPGTEVEDAAAAQAVLDDALARGHEGVMVKDLGSPYEAGRRGAAWRKVKPAHTFDLVVLAAEWGSGRRQGWLSNLHLGARDPASGGFVMLGKTFKGLTDEVLVWQTQRLLDLETSRDGPVVHVRPELVVEIAVDGVQTSTRYPGGVALRFARVRGYREDKPAEAADTVDAVRALLGQSAT